jgi:hypothetical protein
MPSRRYDVSMNCFQKLTVRPEGKRSLSTALAARLRATALTLAVISAPLVAQTKTTIDFNELSGPSAFTGVQPSLNEGIATFSGGQVLSNATNLPVDRGSVYGTSSFCQGCLSSISIVFSQTVSNFSVVVINGNTVTVTYTVRDDQGGIQTITLVPNVASGSGMIVLPENNISSVSIAGGSAPNGCCA